jgi:AraC family transcriptional regulator
MARMHSEDDVNSIVISLIMKAESALEADRAISKDCLIRAHALLKLTRCENNAPVEFADRGGLAPWQKQRVRTYIEGHLSSRIAMLDLTSIARLSTSHFARAFKKSFGDAPFAYISQLRIGRAKRLMLETHSSLSQIALDCGMCDQSHFTRVFRRLVGESPNNWRRGHSSGENYQAPSKAGTVQRQHAVV